MDEMFESSIQVFLIVVVWTWLDLSSSLPFLLPLNSIIGAFFTITPTLDCLLHIRLRFIHECDHSVTQPARRSKEKQLITLHKPILRSSGQRGLDFRLVVEIEG